MYYSAIFVCALRFTSIRIVATWATSLVSAALSVFFPAMREIILIVCEYNFYVWLKHFAQKIVAWVLFEAKFIFFFININGVEPMFHVKKSSWIYFQVYFHHILSYMLYEATLFVCLCIFFATVDPHKGRFAAHISVIEAQQRKKQQSNGPYIEKNKSYLCTIYVNTKRQKEVGMPMPSRTVIYHQQRQSCIFGKL